MKNLLLVDDELDLLESLSDILDIDGKFNKIYTAGSAKEALELLKKQHIDVMVTDVNMPSMTGPELVKEVINNYKNYNFLNIPKKIFYLTGNIGNQDILCIKCVDEILLKPVSNYDLFQEKLLA